MVKDVSNALIDGFSIETLKCEIPALFSTLEGFDNNFEFTSASSALSVDLLYSWNKAIETVGVIFVNTEIRNWSIEPNATMPSTMPYTEEDMQAKERGELARRAFATLGV